jgi:hypothetical protein
LWAFCPSWPHDPPDLCLLSSQYYWLEPPCLVWVYCLFLYF